MKWKIVADTSCNLRKIEGLANDTQFERAPITLRIEDKEYIEIDNFDTAAMLDHMYSTQEKADSSCPSPENFKKAFEGAENVIAITITGTLSGSYNSAVIGKNLLLEENPKVNVHIIDSLSASGEVDLIVEEINNLIIKGLEFDEVVKEIDDFVKRTKLLFILEKVDNLVKNGRLSKLVGGVIGLLNVRLLGQASDEGKLELLHKPRGTKKAIIQLVDEMIKTGYLGGRVRIAHCFNENSCEEIKKLVISKFPEACVKFIPMSAVCCFYAERGGIMVGYER